MLVTELERAGLGAGQVECRHRGGPPSAAAGLTNRPAQRNSRPTLASVKLTAPAGPVPTATKPWSSSASPWIWAKSATRAGPVALASVDPLSDSWPLMVAAARQTAPDGPGPDRGQPAAGFLASRWRRSSRSGSRPSGPGRCHCTRTRCASPGGRRPSCCSGTPRPSDASAPAGSQSHPRRMVVIAVSPAGLCCSISSRTCWPGWRPGAWPRRTCAPSREQPAADGGAADDEDRPWRPAPAASNRRPDATSASSTRSLCTVRPSASRAGPVWLVSRAPLSSRSPLIRASGRRTAPALALAVGAEVLVEPGPVPDRDEVGQQGRPGLVDQGGPAQRQLAGDGRPGQADRAQRARAGRGQALMTALAGARVALDGQVLGHQRGHGAGGQLGVPQHQVARDRAARQADRAHRPAPVGRGVVTSPRGAVRAGTASPGPAGAPGAASAGPHLHPRAFQRQLPGDGAAAQQDGALPAAAGRPEVPA